MPIHINTQDRAGDLIYRGMEAAGRSIMGARAGYADRMAAAGANLLRSENPYDRTVGSGILTSGIDDVTESRYLDSGLDRLMGAGVLTEDEYRKAATGGISQKRALIGKGFAAMEANEKSRAEQSQAAAQNQASILAEKRRAEQKVISDMSILRALRDSAESDEERAKWEAQEKAYAEGDPVTRGAIGLLAAKQLDIGLAGDAADAQTKAKARAIAALTGVEADATKARTKSHSEGVMEANIEANREVLQAAIDSNLLPGEIAETLARSDPGEVGNFIRNMYAELSKAEALAKKDVLDEVNRYKAIRLPGTNQVGILDLREKTFLQNPGSTFLSNLGDKPIIEDEPAPTGGTKSPSGLMRLFGRGK